MREVAEIARWTLTAYPSPAILIILAAYLVGIIAPRVRHFFAGDKSCEPCPCCLSRRLDELSGRFADAEVDFPRGDR